MSDKSCYARSESRYSLVMRGREGGREGYKEHTVRLDERENSESNCMYKTTKALIMSTISRSRIRNDDLPTQKIHWHAQ